MNTINTINTPEHLNISTIIYSQVFSPISKILFNHINSILDTVVRGSVEDIVEKTAFAPVHDFSYFSAGLIQDACIQYIKSNE